MVLVMTGGRKWTRFCILVYTPPDHYNYNRLGSGSCSDARGKKLGIETGYGLIGATSKCRENCDADVNCQAYQQSGTQSGVGGTGDCVKYRKAAEKVSKQNNVWASSICYQKGSPITSSVSAAVATSFPCPLASSDQADTIFELFVQFRICCTCTSNTLVHHTARFISLCRPHCNMSSTQHLASRLGQTRVVHAVLSSPCVLLLMP